MSLVGLGVVVGTAAAIGAVARHLAGMALNTDFPYGTLVVNLVASFALGVVVGADDPVPLILGIGGLGALSTWSTAANEAAIMARDDQLGLGVGYLTLSISSGTLLAWTGLQVGPILF